MSEVERVHETELILLQTAASLSRATDTAWGHERAKYDTSFPSISNKTHRAGSERCEGMASTWEYQCADAPGIQACVKHGTLSGFVLPRSLNVKHAEAPKNSDRTKIRGGALRLMDRRTSGDDRRGGTETSTRNGNNGDLAPIWLGDNVKTRYLREGGHLNFWFAWAGEGYSLEPPTLHKCSAVIKVPKGGS